MNFLAHAYLSFGDPELLTGNLMADTVKGTEPRNFTAGIARGIELHRAIDAYTDHHALVRSTRKIFYPTISHYALVISDVIYDHFLGINWHRYSNETLLDFSIRSYAAVDRYIQYAPEKFTRIFPYMKEDNWFVMYATLPGIHATIERLSYRSKAFTQAKETIALLTTHYHELENHFLEFFPQLVAHSHDFLKDYETKFS